MTPIIIGGSGHSGTRIFAQCLEVNGVFMGIPRLTQHPDSNDLMMINLLSRWVIPYRSGALSDEAKERMKRQFRRHLRLCLPFRWGLWGFKNPRTMLLLDFFNDLFPEMKFIHVVRDGRDMSFGNVFAGRRNVHAPLFLSAEEEERLSPSANAMVFWGRSNLATRQLGRQLLKERYMLLRFEDLCDAPGKVLPELLEFAGCSLDKLEPTLALVQKPKSVGRWRSFDPAELEATIHEGRKYLAEFGYDA